MDQVNRIFCKLCLKGITDRKFQVLGEVILEVLSVLSLNVNLDEKCNYMCNDCSVKLFAAFDFKVICLDTEDSLFPFVHSKKTRQIDLRNVYLKVKGGNATFTSNQEICRLCMHVADDDGFISIEKLCDRNIVDKYIPEINFSSTKDPVVCKQCYSSLSIHIDWLRKWMDIDEKIEIEPEDLIYEKSCCERSASDASDDKFEEHNEYGNVFLSDSKKEISNKRVTSTNTQTSHSSSFYGAQENCLLRNPNDSEAICKNNDNKITFESDSVVSQLRRKDSSKARMRVQRYNYGKCDYRTKKKSDFGKHQLRHKHLSEVQMYKCDKCDHQTKWKRNLTVHQLRRHTDLTEVDMYKCDECDYQSSIKYSFLRHQLRHRDSSELRTYNCDKCDFQTKQKSYLKKHQLRHRDPSEVHMYKCNDCDYRSSFKNNFVRHHLLKHRKLQCCLKCDFQTKHKRSLMKHKLLKHGDS